MLPLPMSPLDLTFTWSVNSSDASDVSPDASDASDDTIDLLLFMAHTLASVDELQSNSFASWCDDNLA